MRAAPAGCRRSARSSPVCFSWGSSPPPLPLPGLTLVCEDSPTDAVAGAAVELSVIGNRSMRRGCGESVGGTPLVLGPQVPGRLVIVARRRGRSPRSRSGSRTAAPFGLLWWSRDQVLSCPCPLYVAPQAREHNAVTNETPANEEGRRPPRPALSGDLRGVRPYQHGDGRRRVHWRATGHTGDLMVRESEIRTDDPVRIVAELSRDEDTADRLAEEAMGEVLAQLKAGRSVILETTEPVGRVVAAVMDRVSAGRRLARAVAPLDLIEAPR